MAPSPSDLPASGSPCASSPGRFDRRPDARPESAHAPLVGVIMGSRSDWDTMRHAVETLASLNVPHETRVVSAHRTPDLLFEYAAAAEGRGLRVIIAGAGGAAHLPGMVASKTVLPVLGVPVQSRALKGLDSLLSIVQMPGGVPVGTMAIGVPGATNAALLAVRILGAADPGFRDAARAHARARTEAVLADPDPSVPPPRLSEAATTQLQRPPDATPPPRPSEVATTPSQAPPAVAPPPQR